MHLRLIELPVSRSAHVIFHITRATSLFWIGRVAEKLGNNGTERLCQNIMQNIQPSTVRHADDNFAEAELAAALEDLFQRRNDRLTTIQTKALGPGIFLMKIPLKFCGITIDSEKLFLLSHTALRVTVFGMFLRGNM